MCVEIAQELDTLMEGKKDRSKVRHEKRGKKGRGLGQTEKFMGLEMRKK